MLLRKRSVMDPVHGLGVTIATVSPGLSGTGAVATVIGFGRSAAHAVALAAAPSISAICVAAADDPDASNL